MTKGAFAMLSPSSYPISMTFRRVDTDEVVFEEVITLDMAAKLVSVEIPPLARECGVPVRLRMEYGDGVVVEEEPPRSVWEEMGFKWGWRCPKTSLLWWEDQSSASARAHVAECGCTLVEGPQPFKAL